MKPIECGIERAVRSMPHSFHETDLNDPRRDSRRARTAQFIEFALAQRALAFGDFTTKAGRRSPYFFNTGRFDSGGSVGALGKFYAKTLVAAEREHGLAFDLLFGPAYKGITLAAATAMALAALPPDEGGRDVGFAYNRKEAKTHGDAGTLVGAKLAGRVVIVDDVLTDGASKRESVDIIRAAGAEPVAVVIAMDRMERRDDSGAMESAVQTFEADYGIPVYAIANLDDLMDWLGRDGAGSLAAHAPAVTAYRARYGARSNPMRASA
jgi:orotate phosphoribosyltransferase